MKKRIGPLLGKHLLLIAAIGAAILLVGCPIRTLFCFPCPGCGLTRACLAALRLDFAQAFREYPLFPIAIPALFYLIHRERLPKKLPVRLEIALAILLVLACLAVYGYRLQYDPTMKFKPGFSLLRLFLDRIGYYHY